MSFFLSSLRRSSTTETPPVSQHRRFVELDSLRGVAALTVVLFHVYGNKSPTSETLHSPTFDGVLNLFLTSIFPGTGAVMLFFVLSGFVLSESLKNFEILNWRIYAAFITKRLFRLMPLVWASIGLAIVFLILFHKAPVPWSRVPYALLTDRDAIGPFNGPLWSVNVELISSGLFPVLLFANRQIGVVGRILLLVGLVWAMKFYGEVYVAYFLFCFQLGIMIRDLTEPVFCKLSAGAAHVLVFIAILMIMIPTNASRMGLIQEISHVRLEGFGAMILIGYVLSLHGARSAAALRWPPLIFLGTISYSLYVLHFPIIGVLDHIAWRFIPAEHYFPAQTLAACLVLPTTIVASYLAYTLIELPLQTVGRQLGDRILGRRVSGSQADALSPQTDGDFGSNISQTRP